MNISRMSESPVSTHKYKIYNIDTLPKVMLCVSVKSRYDENRLVIKPIYRPKHILHFQTIDRELRPLYYYGIELKLQPPYLSMATEITRAEIFSNRSTDAQRLVDYNVILNEFDVTCNTCYGYLTDGIYPIDMSHLQKITRKDYSDEISTGFTCMLNKKTKQEPIYNRVPNFNILIFTRSTGYDN